MDIWVENDSTGKFLYAVSTADAGGFETGMLRSVISENILPVSSVFRNEKKCFEYNISGYVSLNEYIAERKLDSSDISGILIRTGKAVDTLRNYLLSESDLMLESSRIYVDTEEKELRFCVIPGNNCDFETCLKKLITELIMRIDEKDADALQLGFRLFNCTGRTEFRLHDIIDVIRKFRPENGAPAAEETVKIPEQDVSEYYRKPFDADYGNRYEDPVDEETEPILKSRRKKSKISNDESADDGKIKREPGEIRRFITGAAVSEAVLLLGVLIIYLIKGRGLVIRMLPVYIVLAICIAAYNAVDILIRKRQAAAENAS